MIFLDLPTGAKIILFADDTNLFLSTKTINELEYKASFYLKNLNNWLNANRLHLNMDMTCYSILSPNRSLASTVTITFNNIEIECVNNCKYLGVNIDNRLNGLLLLTLYDRN